MAAPTIGRVVIALANPAENNGSDVAPATITRVWNEQPDGSWIVNIRVTLDGENTSWKTSVKLCDTEEQARAAGGHSCFWPPRIGG